MCPDERSPTKRRDPPGRRPWLSSALFRFAKWGNPFVDERFSWPYPMYDRMRADGPVSYGLALPRKAYADLGAGGDKIDEIRPWYRPECARYYPPLSKDHPPNQ